MADVTRFTANEILNAIFFHHNESKKNPFIMNPVLWSSTSKEKFSRIYEIKFLSFRLLKLLQGFDAQTEIQILNGL